jgi:hypothetical protein
LLFGDALGDHGGDVPMEKMRHPVVDASETGPKLMDTILSVVGFRPAQPMSKVLKAFQAREAFGLGFGWQTVAPFQQWHRTVFLLVKQHFCCRQSSDLDCSQNCEKVK